jgi:hypothetical protein
LIIRHRPALTANEPANEPAELPDLGAMLDDGDETSDGEDIEDD